MARDNGGGARGEQHERAEAVIGNAPLDASEGGVHVPAERLQAVWDDLRERHQEIVTARTLPPDAWAQGWTGKRIAMRSIVHTYGVLVGIPNLDVTQYLKDGQLVAPITPLETKGRQA